MGTKLQASCSYAPSILIDFSQSQTARYGALCKAFQGLGASGSCSIPIFKHVLDMIEKEKNYVYNFPEDELNKGKRNSATK